MSSMQELEDAYRREIAPKRIGEDEYLAMRHRATDAESKLRALNFAVREVAKALRDGELSGPDAFAGLTRALDKAQAPL